MKGGASAGTAALDDAAAFGRIDLGHRRVSSTSGPSHGFENAARARPRDLPSC